MRVGVASVVGGRGVVGGLGSAVRLQDIYTFVEVRLFGCPSATNLAVVVLGVVGDGDGGRRGGGRLGVVLKGAMSSAPKKRARNTPI